MVTDLRNKYKQDPFFRTECNVILLLLAFAIVLVTLVSFAFSYLYSDITSTLFAEISASIKNGGTPNAVNILSTIQSVKIDHLLVFGILTIILIMLLGYFIARVTMLPARNTLISQKRFISDVAHELRTPLSVIKTNSEVTLMDLTISSSVRRALKTNIEELDRASDIINNLLSLGSLSRSNQMNFEVINLGTVIESAIKKMSPLAHNKGLEITVKKTGPRSVWGNNTALEQIIVNLVKNAINFTPRGGNITVVLEPDYRGNILLSVQDSGIGISQDDLFHIFEPYFQVDRSRHRESGSSGLGLTIVNELVKLHSGKIIIRSASNRGTTAIVSFPFSQNTPNFVERRKISEVSVDYLQ